MSLPLSGKVAIVTGASKGIGAGIAKSLAEAGAAVAVNYSSSREGADNVVNHIKSTGGQAVAIQGSVDKAADVQRIFEAANTAFGHIDIVVNNAGVFKFDAVEDVTEDEFHREFNINVLGPILTTQQAVKYFPASGGSIVNITSVVSKNPSANASVYASTKGAVDTLTRGLAVELASKNIRVNAVAPGPVETEGFETLGMKGSDFEKILIESTPLKRVGQPDDIARVVTFLVSDAASWITGERLNASGGLI